MGWVNAGISAIAEAVGSVPWRIELRQPDDLYAPVERGAAADLLEQPNDFCSAFELREGIAGWLMGHGNAYLELAPNAAGKIGEMWLLDSRNVRIVPDRKEFIKGYLLRVDGLGKPVRLDPDRVVHIKLFNILDPFYGISPLVAIIRALEANVAADDLNMRFFLNDATPGGVLESKQESMSPEQRDMLRESWETAHRGRDNKFRPAVLWGGLEWKQVTASHTDMAFVELDKRTQDKILGVLGVSNAEVGDFRDLTFATALMQDRSFWTKTIIPILNRIEQILSRQLLPHLAPALGIDLVHDRKAARIRFDTSKVKALSTVSVEEAEVHAIYVKNRVMSPNEVREEIGRAPYEGGDEIHGPINEIPLAQIRAAIGQSLRSAHLLKDFRELVEEEPRMLPSLGSAERRDLIWRRFDNQLRPNERMVRRFVRLHFSRQKDRVLDNLRAWASEQAKGAPCDCPNPERGHRGACELTRKQSVAGLTTNLIFDTAEEAAAFADAMQSPMTEVAVEFGNAALAGVGIDDPYNEASTALQNFLRRRLKKMSKRTQDTIFNDLESLIAESVAEGETVAELSSKINQFYGNVDKIRSLRIARTETGSAANFGLIDGYEQSGVVVGKEWLTSRDSNVRDSHQIDGQVRKLSEKFDLDSGAKAKYPLDPSLSADESVNCRCGTAPVIDEDALKARGGILDPLFLTKNDVPHLMAA